LEYSKVSKLFCLVDGEIVCVDQKLNVSEKKLFNKIYGFGFNKYGQLGIEKGVTIKTPTMILFFEDSKIRTLSSGCNHTIVLTGNHEFIFIHL